MTQPQTGAAQPVKKTPPATQARYSRYQPVQPKPLNIINSMDKSFKTPLIMLIYGEGGVGKTTFGATAPKPILADCEGGTKYFRNRGISIDVAQIESWSQMKDFAVAVKDYETIIIDPIGELMDKLKRFMVSRNDSKLTQRDGSPTMAGWGWLKSTLRDYLKAMRDSGKHVIIIAHLDEKDDDGKLVKRPLIATKLSVELVNMVDVVGYMTIVGNEDDQRRVIIVDPSGDKYTAKDRTGMLGKFVFPDFTMIADVCRGEAVYEWASDLAKQTFKKSDNEDNSKDDEDDGDSQEVESDQEAKEAPEKEVESREEVKTPETNPLQDKLNKAKDKKNKSKVGKKRETKKSKTK